MNNEHLFDFTETLPGEHGWNAYYYRNVADGIFKTLDFLRQTDFVKDGKFSRHLRVHNLDLDVVSEPYPHSFFINLIAVAHTVKAGAIDAWAQHGPAAGEQILYQARSLMTLRDLVAGDITHLEGNPEEFLSSLREAAINLANSAKASDELLKSRMENS